MAGKFVNTGYESDSGFVCLIRMSQSEANATTLSPTAVDTPFHCLNSGSTKKFGVHPRGVNLSRVVGVAPNTFNVSSFLAYPTAAGWNAVAVGSTVSVGGVDWTVAKKRPEILA